MESGLQILLQVSEEPQVFAVALPPSATRWLRIQFYILLQYMRCAEQQISDFLTPQ